MNTDDLYAVLELPREATGADVLKAYRRLSKEYHEDRNPGDDDAKAKFAAVDRAYRVLGDPERRAKYDANGEIDEPKPDRAFAELASVLAPLLMAVVKEVLKQRHTVTEQNIVHHMKNALTEGVKQFEKQLKALELERVALTLAADRFQVEGDAPNLLAMAVADHLSQNTAAVEHTVREVNRMKKALEYLGTCSYRTEVRSFVSVGYGSNWATTAASTF